MGAILKAEPLIRLSVFAGVFALLAAWEVLAPRRSQDIGRAWRWPNNLGVVVVDTLVLRVLPGFKWSSQHLERGGCDDCSEAAFGSVWARRLALAWSALCGAA